MEDEEERLCTLHEAILDSRPRPESDFFEIGYAAKLTGRILREDGWEIHKVHRYGAFHRSDDILTDQAIILEISGDSGTSYQRYKRNFNPQDRSQFEDVVRGVGQVLSENSAWKRQIGAVLQDLKDEPDVQNASIDLYNPSTALLTFYLAVSDENGTEYISQYLIEFDHKGVKTLVFGCLVWDGSKTNFNNVLRKHYNGSFADMTHSLLWGGYDARDSKVMKSIGFRYRTFRLEIRGDERSFSALTDDGWEDCAERHLFGDFFRIYRENPELVRDVCELYASKWSNGILDLSD